MSNVKVGDKVKYMHDVIGEMDWAKEDELVKGQLYTVRLVIPDFNGTYIYVIPFGPCNYAIDIEQFDVIKVSNEERMKRRMEELNI